MIETRLLRNALVLAEQQNFARAAQALNISQPTLSRNIQTLEKRIGARLFDRMPRKVLPTPAGEELLKHARHVVSSTQALEEGMQHYLGLGTGRLSIGAALIASSSLLGPAIGRFKEQYPNIRVNIEVDNWFTLYDRLRQSEFDFILTETGGLNGKQDLEVMNLIPRQGFFFCRQGHPILKTTLRTPGDLRQFPLILPTLPERLANMVRQLVEIARDDLQSSFSRRALRLDVLF